jgi:hypothetical protein
MQFWQGFLGRRSGRGVRRGSWCSRRVTCESFGRPCRKDARPRRCVLRARPHQTISQLTEAARGMIGWPRYAGSRAGKSARGFSGASSDDDDSWSIHTIFPHKLEGVEEEDQDQRARQERGQQQHQDEEGTGNGDGVGSNLRDQVSRANELGDEAFTAGGR